MKYVNRFSVYHVIVSFLLYCIFYRYTQKPLTAASISITLGLGREVYDHLKKHKNTYAESAFDMLANILGIILGAIVMPYLLPA